MVTNNYQRRGRAGLFRRPSRLTSFAESTQMVRETVTDYVRVRGLRSTPEPRRNWSFAPLERLDGGPLGVILRNRSGGAGA